VDADGNGGVAAVQAGDRPRQDMGRHTAK
jgi:hypothetical protein